MQVLKDPELLNKFQKLGDILKIIMDSQLKTENERKRSRFILDITTKFQEGKPELILMFLLDYPLRIKKNFKKYFKEVFKISENIRLREEPIFGHKVIKLKKIENYFSENFINFVKRVKRKHYQVKLLITDDSDNTKLYTSFKIELGLFLNYNNRFFLDLREFQHVYEIPFDNIKKIEVL